MKVVLKFKDLVDAQWWSNFAKSTKSFQTLQEIDEYLKEFNAQYNWGDGNWALIFEDEIDLSAFLLRWS